MLGIIIVNYKNEKKTISFVRNVLSFVNLPSIVIIVNNEASSESNKILVSELEGELITDISKTPNSQSLYVISNPENLGFAKGNNIGVEFAIKYFDISHILFTNNDILFINENIVESLIIKLESLGDKIALIGPRVLGLDGRNQSPEPYISFWNRYFWMYWITPFLSTKKKCRLFKLDYSNNAIEGIHYKISGSFFLVKSKDYIACGMMDSNTFLYGEELILSERLKNIDKFCYFYPTVSILHEHCQTTNSYLSNDSRQTLRFKNECYYYRKYMKVSGTSIIVGRFSLKFYMFLKKISS